MRVVSEANQREHWVKKAKRAKAQRSATKLLVATERFKQKLKTLGKATLVRHGPRFLDDDNLHGAFKAVRDGIADAFGVDDGPKGGVTWEYAQVKSKEYWVEILIWGDTSK